jgi:hypothetical protein
MVRRLIHLEADQFHSAKDIRAERAASPHLAHTWDADLPEVLF